MFLTHRRLPPAARVVSSAGDCSRAAAMIICIVGVTIFAVASARASMARTAAPAPASLPAWRRRRTATISKSPKRSSADRPRATCTSCSRATSLSRAWSRARPRTDFNDALVVLARDQLGRVSITRYKVLGFVISLSLLFGYEPMAEAAPATVPSSAVISNADGLVVQAVIAGGVWRREARRQKRRAIRRHGY